MGTILLDLRYTWRIIRRKPTFVAAVILTLALGIGANTAVFSVVNAVLFKPLPYPDADRLVLFQTNSERGSGRSLSPLNFQDLVSQSGVFEDASAIGEYAMSLTGVGEPQRLNVGFVSWNFFRVLQMEPVPGRGFGPEEGVAGKGHVAVISHGTWQRIFGGNQDVMGSTIMLDGIVYTVIGVASDSIQFPENMDVWLPLIFSADEVDPSQRGASWIRTICRLKKDTNFDEANAIVRQVWSNLAEAYPRTNTNSTVELKQLHDYLTSPVKRSVILLLGAVGFMLLIACANVTNLLLTHAIGRENEIAVRSALGAKKPRLIRQFLVESLLLTGVSTVVGLLIALWCIELFSRMAPAEISRIHTLGIDTRVLLFTIGLSTLTGLMVGTLPALQVSKSSIDQVLRAGGRGLVGGGKKARTLLVVSEVALAFMLLMGAGLLLKSFLHVNGIDPGFQPDHVLTFEISLPESRYTESHQIATFFSELDQRLSEIQGIQSASAVFGLPFSKTGPAAHSSFTIQGRERTERGEEPGAGLRVVTSEYFSTMGIRLEEGRFFTPQDQMDSQQVAIINESAARRYWPGQNPLGQEIRPGVSLTAERSRPRIVVGIVADAKYSTLEKNIEPDIYIPHAQHSVSWMMMAVRTESDPMTLIPAVKSTIYLIDPSVPISNVHSMSELIGASMAERSFTLLLLAAFAVIALLLAAVGIYGVLSYSVVQRTREIGLRMVLGANRGDILRMMIRDGLLFTFAGSLIGLAGALAVSRSLAGFLFEVTPTDAWTFVFVVAVFTLVSLLSCYIPTRRAMKVNATVALRYE